MVIVWLSVFIMIIVVEYNKVREISLVSEFKINICFFVNKNLILFWNLLINFLVFNFKWFVVFLV